MRLHYTEHPIRLLPLKMITELIITPFLTLITKDIPLEPTLVDIREDPGRLDRKNGPDGEDLKRKIDPEDEER